MHNLIQHQSVLTLLQQLWTYAQEILVTNCKTIHIAKSLHDG